MSKVKKTYILLLHVFLVVILYKSNFIEKSLDKFHLVSSPEINPYFKRMTEYHRHMDKSTPEGSIIFIGDSITQGLNTAAIGSIAINYGIGSDTTEGVLKRLKYYSWSLKSSTAIVLAIGVNDLRRRSNEEIIQNYKKIISKLPHHKKIIISSIMPVGIEKEKNDSMHWNSRIRTINNHLHEFEKKYVNITFLDVNSKLSDKNQLLPAIYHVGDGVHLNSKGYKIWIDEINKLTSS